MGFISFFFFFFFLNVLEFTSQFLTELTHTKTGDSSEGRNSLHLTYISRVKLVFLKDWHLSDFPFVYPLIQLCLLFKSLPFREDEGQVHQKLWCWVINTERAQWNECLGSTEQLSSAWRSGKPSQMRWQVNGSLKEVVAKCLKEDTWLFKATSCIIAFITSNVFGSPFKKISFCNSFTNCADSTCQFFLSLFFY